ncbi:uncharacterized protein BO96DRAFT_431049 [Aspergillus niger CBS 101883]|uniref:uncharacterized protein n=1 Tax=Aspergillus lacticoffeatus (strain CBS 101883) TaxID=1450533 RepID=UPI000D7F6531|nr:uncharacterized protein BO96DRAFT_431049 [Aspergillus niger CBS 101883]PYH59945.1 hypothetical protein BO96DRAFT_431049 [Aspergillus niger CBS 101883]
MYCAFIDCMSYNKAEIRGCRKGEVDATWPVCEGPGTGVPSSLRSTVPGREVPCTSMGISRIVLSKFLATLSCKRVAFYKFPAKVLAAGRENNRRVFQETHCPHRLLRDALNLGRSRVPRSPPTNPDA